MSSLPTRTCTPSTYTTPTHITDELPKVLAAMAPQLVAEAAQDRRVVGSTDAVRARAAIIDAALAWRQGGSAMALVAAIDAAAAEGHVTLPSDRSEP